MRTAKNKRIRPKILKLFEAQGVTPSPLLLAQLDEVDNVSTFISQLWTHSKTQPLFTDYTNKAGATNTTASAVVKELRAWEVVHTSAVRSLFRMVQTELAMTDEDDFGLSEFE